MARTRLIDAYEKAGQRLREQASKRKNVSNKKSFDPPLNIGDKVYLRNRVLGRNKIQDSWDNRVFVVIEVPSKDGAP